MSLDVWSPSKIQAFHSLKHPLAIDLQLCQVEDSRRSRRIVEGFPNEFRLELIVAVLRSHGKVLTIGTPKVPWLSSDV